MKNIVMNTATFAILSSLTLFSPPLVNGMQDPDDATERAQQKSAALAKAKKEADEANEAAKSAENAQDKADFSQKWAAQKEANEKATGDPELTTKQKLSKEGERLGRQAGDKFKKAGEALGDLFK